MAWSKESKASWTLRHSDDKATLSKLSSTERLRFMSFGEVPRYFNSLLRLSSDQHPMVQTVKDATRLIAHALPPGVKAGADARTRAQAYR